jgi:hypothetical protein
MSLTVVKLSHLNCINSPQINRYGHTISILDSKKVFIFGGLLMNYDPKNTKSLMYTLDFTNQMLFFDLEKKEWNPEPMKVDGNAPAGRHFHSAVVYEKNLYIFGGKSNGYKNDLYKYDTGKIILIKKRGKHLDFN